ncbi:MAG: rhomboid family intramembrane serine protease [Bacteroidota bacterium]|nr:rhomboid family intramembrane serine protease [Bacteroidota bacterium]
MIEDLKVQKEKLIHSLWVAGGLSALMIFLHLLFLILPVDKLYWGIFPRDFHQWYGIFTGHFIHSSWSHLFSNLPPLVVTTLLIFFFYRSIGWAVLSLTLIATGFAVFIFARSSTHIGASGLVYGLIAFVFFSGLFRRNIKSIALTGIVAILYSGYSAGFLPIDEQVSWESHLFGAIAGLWTAFIFKNYREHDDNDKLYDWKGLDRTPKDYFLERDTFEKTIAEREEEEQKKKEADQQNSWNSSW